VSAYALRQINVEKRTCLRDLVVHNELRFDTRVHVLMSSASGRIILVFSVLLLQLSSSFYYFESLYRSYIPTHSYYTLLIILLYYLLR
jgi:hypothetical protein